MPEGFPQIESTKFNFKLLESTEQFLDVILSEQTLVTSLTFTVSGSELIQKFSISVREMGIQFPEQFSHWGTHKLHFGELDTATSRKIYIEPVMCDRLKIFVDEGNAVVSGTLEIFGNPWKKVYKSDPIFEPRALESEFWAGASTMKIDVAEQGLCPDGSIFVTSFATRDSLTTDNLLGKCLFNSIIKL